MAKPAEPLPERLRGEGVGVKGRSGLGQIAGRPRQEQSGSAAREKQHEGF